VARRLDPFWQWHLKSVIDEQPSVERGVMKQLSCGVLVMTLVNDCASTYGARWDVVKLSRGNSGQSNDGGDSESLHDDQ
jgi:hypothetical protein